MRAFLIRLTVAGLLLGAATGCADSGPAATRPDPAGPAPSAAARLASEQFTFRLPIAAYSYSLDDEIAIDAAKKALTDSCLAGFGMDYRWPEPVRGAPRADRRYGISSAVDARSYGYHLPPDGPPPGAEVSEEIARVLYGSEPGQQFAGKAVPENGCRGKAVADLEAKFIRSPGAEVAREISVSSYERAKKDSRLVGATQKWSACMSRKGFEYATPIDASTGFSLKDEKPSEKEIATAVADISCKGESGLLGIWFTAESDVQKSMIRAHRKVLDGLRESHAVNVHTARAIASR
ncbi:hypothetical protein ABZZ79_04500 [Streptomyces sp. NPDC006458]|uniref:hypothetical protein n=1 Tax=Streptomyces sp. NPDC006458 TaxID=3154302 RepID=UPI0033BD57DB